MVLINQNPSLISFFRHSHKYNFGCSDIYVVTHLTPTSQGQVISKCERELAKCQWMPIQDYIDADNVNNVNKFYAKQFLEMRDKGLAIAMNQVEMKIKHFVRDQQIYTVKRTEDCAQQPPKV